MKDAPLVPSERYCAICDKKNSIKEIDTYKSTWLYCESCGCYSRVQKSRYPLEGLSTPLFEIFKHIPKLNGFLASLGRKKQGVDFYRYYSDQLATGQRGPWEGQWNMVTNELRSAGLLQDWTGKKVLEISGEPGFFAQDVMKAGGDILVSAFADDVASAMRERLGLRTFVYDFNKDDILKCIESEGGSDGFDFIFIRFAIGFCEDLPGLMRKMRLLLRPKGVLYISFSPASRVVPLRWMFDDYTYLRQYTEAYVNDSAKLAALSMRFRFDEGFFYWDRGPFSLHWSLRPFARHYLNNNSFYKEGEVDDSVQRRVALAYVKGD